MDLDQKILTFRQGVLKNQAQVYVHCKIRPKVDASIIVAINNGCGIIVETVVTRAVCDGNVDYFKSDEPDQSAQAFVDLSHKRSIFNTNLQLDTVQSRSNLVAQFIESTFKELGRTQTTLKKPKEKNEIALPELVGRYKAQLSSVMHLGIPLVRHLVSLCVQLMPEGIAQNLMADSIFKEINALSRRLEKWNTLHYQGIHLESVPEAIEMDFSL